MRRVEIIRPEDLGIARLFTRVRWAPKSMTLKVCVSPTDNNDVTMDPDSTQPARVLIAEDHALVREGLRVMLAKEEQIEVVGEAEDGRQAVEMCRSLDPDLVLMDVRMPKMDGLEATRTIKESHPETSVLMVTTYQSPDYLLDAIRAGAAGYILKEASRQELLNSISKVLGGEPVLDQGLAMRLLMRLSEEAARNGNSSSEHPTKESREEITKPLASFLSNREIDALRLIAIGKTNRQIAQELMISFSTVKTYVQRIIKKLGVSDRTQACVKATELGLISGQK